MGFLRKLCSYRVYTFLRQQNTSNLVRSSSFDSPVSCVAVNVFLSSSLIYQRTFSDITQLVSENIFEEGSGNELIDSDKSDESIKTVKKKTGKKSTKVEDEEVSNTSMEGVPTVQSKLYSLFASKPKTGNSISVKNSSETKKNHASKREKASRALKMDESKPRTSNSVSVKNSSETTSFSKREKASRSVKPKPLKENRPATKEISPEMVSLVNRWYVEGYLNNANFLAPEKFDINCFSNHYSLDFLRSTAERFGQDHQEIAKWLSGAALKRVALFGCPSVERKSVFSAKRLRSFFSIQEDTVCRVCKLKSSCKFVNQKVWQKVGTLNLTDVMRILISYDLDSGPPELEIPYEMKGSISKVLKEVVNLSQ